MPETVAQHRYTGRHKSRKPKADNDTLVCSAGKTISPKYSVHRIDFMEEKVSELGSYFITADKVRLD